MTTDLRPTEILRSIGASVLGMATAGAGATTGNIWAVIAGSAIGAGGVAWTFGIWLRDRSFQYLRMQNNELWVELNKLREEIAVERHRAAHTMPASDLGHPHSEGS